MIVTVSPSRESVASLEREERPVPKVCRVLEVSPELPELTGPRCVKHLGLKQEHIDFQMIVA